FPPRKLASPRVNRAGDFLRAFSDFPSTAIVFAGTSRRSALCGEGKPEIRVSARRQCFHQSHGQEFPCGSNWAERRRIDRCRSCPDRLRTLCVAAARNFERSQKFRGARRPHRDQSGQGAVAAASAESEKENRTAA